MPLVLAVEAGVVIVAGAPRTLQPGWSGWVTSETLKRYPFLRRLYGAPPPTDDDEVLVLEDEVTP
jgi:hypothetical protein